MSKTLPMEGDLILFRKQRCRVLRVTKWTVRFLSAHRNIVTVRCLKPVAEGGFDEAKILAHGP